MRSALLPGLTTDTLASTLEAWKRGDLRQCFQLWEDMAERDDVIKNVKAKREKTVARRAWQVVTVADVPEALKPRAEEQKAVLKKFWNSVRATDAYDRNERGEFSLLVRQMMSAVSYRYAAHHIHWMPEADGLRAEFEFVPLTFFENRAGTLRFCPTGYEMQGEDLKRVGDSQRELGEWIITTGDGLMVAGSICYFIKRNGVADWLILSERIGMRPTVGHTRASADSEAGRAMAEAVEALHKDMAAVIYGADGESKIEKLDTGSVANIPMPDLVERFDRRLAALWRGADLSSFSSTQGQGSGATLQADETAILERDDAMRIQETLGEVSRAVLRYHFGPDVPELAYLQIVVPTASDQKLLISAVEMLVKHGARVSVADVMERLGFAEARDGEEVLTPPIDYNSAYAQNFAEGDTTQTGLDLHNQRQRGTVAALNAAGDEADFVAACTRQLMAAAQRDRAPLASALRECLAADDAGIMERITAFNASLPDYVTQTDEQVKAWHSIIASAALRGWTLGTPENE